MEFITLLVAAFVTGVNLWAHNWEVWCLTSLDYVFSVIALPALVRLVMSQSDSTAAKEALFESDLETLKAAHLREVELLKSMAVESETTIASLEKQKREIWTKQRVPAPACHACVKENKDLKLRLKNAEKDVFDTTTVKTAQNIQSQWIAIQKVMAGAGIRASSFEGYARAIERLCQRQPLEQASPTKEKVLSAELKKVQDALATETAESEAARNQVASLKTVLASKNDELKQLRAELATTARRETAATRAVSNLAQCDHQGLLAEKDQQLQKKEDELKKKQTELEQQKNEAQIARGQVEQLRLLTLQNNTDLHNEREGAQTANAQVNELQASNNGLNALVNELRAGHDQALTMAVESERVRCDLAAQQKISELETQAEQLFQEKITQQAAKLNGDHAAQIRNLNQEREQALSELRTKIESLEEQNRSSNEELINDHTQSIDGYEAFLQAERAEVAALKTRCDQQAVHIAFLRMNEAGQNAFQAALGANVPAPGEDAAVDLGQLPNSALAFALRYIREREAPALVLALDAYRNNDAEGRINNAEEVAARRIAPGRLGRRAAAIANNNHNNQELPGPVVNARNDAEGRQPL